MPQHSTATLPHPEGTASRTAAFGPQEILVSGFARACCRAVIVIPARDEEHSLAATLDSIAAQRDLDGALFPPEQWELLLLLNNCTDGTAEVARRWQQAHPGVIFHLVERELAPEEAHIGTARRLLMDTAWQRLSRHAGQAVILSTDSDTIVGPHWLVETLRAMAAGADAVGGTILLKDGELDDLPEGARTAYVLDRRYQQLVAALEDTLDPQRGDPMPRHLEHFGASLACTAEIYARVGGLPRVERLEDLALVDVFRRADARLRHAPEVKVRTSARMGGRCVTGLSSQLREWQKIHEQGREQLVCSAAWLEHRFRSLRGYRAAWRSGAPPAPSLACGADCGTEGEFLAAIDCDRLIETSFRGRKEEPIQRVIADLERMLSC